MSNLKFLQISDLHLDSSLSHSRLGLPPSKRKRLNSDIAEALEKAVALAKECSVDVVLCPGDMWDDESVSLDGATRIYDLLGSVAPIPVVVAPGNHDPYHRFSYHNPEYYRAKTGRTHPRNVLVFGSPHIDRRTLASLPDVDFYGCCFEANVPRHERLLAGLRPHRADVLNVLVLHGSRDDAIPGEPSAELTAPFSRSELLDAGFDYAALGHYHHHSEIADDAGVVRGAYGGAPVARGLDEAGDSTGFILIGEVTRGGVRPGSLERIRVAPRRVMRLEAPIDSSVLNSAAARQRVEAALGEAGANTADIVLVELTGRTHPDVTRFEFEQDWLDGVAFHLVVDQSRLEPDYDIDGMLQDITAGKRIEGQFVARMKELLVAAEGDPGRTRLLREAMVIGLDALHGREVKPRHVH